MSFVSASVRWIYLIIIIAFIYSSFRRLLWSSEETIDYFEISIETSPLKHIFKKLFTAVSLLYVLWYTNQTINFAQYAIFIYVIEAIVLIIIVPDIFFSITGSKKYITWGRYMNEHFPWVMYLEKYLIFFCFILLLILPFMDFCKANGSGISYYQGLTGGIP